MWWRQMKWIGLAELEQNEEKRIKNGMDVVHTEYNLIRTDKDGMVV